MLKLLYRLFTSCKLSIRWLERCTDLLSVTKKRHLQYERGYVFFSEHISFCFEIYIIA
jgi:hypothetical protein